MPTFSAKELVKFSKNIFKAAGAPSDNAGIVADSLVESNLAGHHSHGVIRIIQYIRAIQAGKLLPDAKPVVSKEGSSGALIDGNHGFGQVVAHYGVDVALKKITSSDIVTIGYYHMDHIGRLGEYVCRAGQKGYLAFAFCNGGGPNVAAYGSKERTFGTNPVACSVPSPDGIPIIIDFSSGALSEGKIRVTKMRGEKLSPGLIIDRNGKPTVEPEDFYSGGAILPIGAGKGSALSFMIELLAGVFTGAGCSIFEDYEDGNGMLLFVMKLDLFRIKDKLLKDIKRLQDSVRHSNPMDGLDSVFIPGELEYKTRNRKLREGVSLDDDSWIAIAAIGSELGVKLPKAL